MTRRAHDLTGQAFGSLIAVERSPEAMNEAGKSLRWRCRCACGREKHVRASTLKQGRSTSCGCESRERWRQRAFAQFNVRLREEAGRPVHRYYLASTRLSAKSRGIPFNLTREQIEALLVGQGFRCALTGVEIGFSSHELPTSQAGRDSTASLNRIDATRGYSIDNVWWLHKDVAGMKMSLPKERFVDLCRMVVGASG